MPFLEISDDTGGLLPWASARLYATMLYSSETQEGEREQIFEEMLVRGADIFESEIAQLSEPNKAYFEKVTSVARRNLHRAGTGSFALADQGRLRGAEGVIAGMMLQFRLRCARHRTDPKDASLNRAEHFMVHQLEENKSKSNGIATAKTMIGKYWRDHRAASHLHAAALACEMDGSDDWLAHKNIPSFLLISEIYRTLAEAKQILDPSLAWRPPPSLRCPVVDVSEETIDGLFPPLSDDEIETLEKYSSRW
jgi:hypothetical protein